MKRKKIILYLAMLAVFIALFSAFVWSVLGSTDSINRDRLEESRRVAQQQIQMNLQYKSKDLSLLAIEYGLAKEDHLEALADRVHATADSKGEYYIIDAMGVLHSSANARNQTKIELSTLKAARVSGYAVASLAALPGENAQLAMIIPLGEDSSFFLAEIMDIDRFFDIIAEDLQLPTDDLLLFNEWGEQMSAYAVTANDEPRIQLANGATAYSDNRVLNAYERMGIGADYSLYVDIGQPHGWFVATKITYAGSGTTVFGLEVSSLIVFVLLVFIMLAVIFLDVLNDREKRRELFRVNCIDELTGLINRTGMFEAFQKEAAKSSFSGYSFVCMDIVAFSRINTMFGHTVGDSVLCTVADVIQSRYFCGSRLNADCFAFLAKTSDDMIPLFENSLNGAIASRLGDEYLQMVSFKFGVCPIMEGAPVFHELYEGALLALKEAKRQALVSCVKYDEMLRQNTELQKNIEVNMMHALSKEEFVVYIQPQFNMPGEKCTRGETLIRWNSEYMGFLPPDQFIPVFERNGFIVETDFFMLESALELLQARIQAGKEPVVLAVNQSKVTVAFPNYYDRLKSTIAHYDVPLKYIELEITESTMENSWETIVPLIHSVKKLGFSIAMDDFGSGFSSLNTLRILPIDVLKIDRAFLVEADSSERCQTIIKNVVRMAKELSICVVCEGVETREQLEFLKGIGCDIVQGYYYSRPIPQQDFISRYFE